MKYYGARDAARNYSSSAVVKLSVHEGVLTLILYLRGDYLFNFFELFSENRVFHPLN
ncbi:MAG: hypothetical protein ACTSRI_13380 [Promethearchaeota archaeon]